MTTVLAIVLFLWIFINIVPTRDPRAIHGVGLVLLLVIVAAMIGFIHVPEWRCEPSSIGRRCTFR